jgi:von Hippel-Lindau disease tumor supressor
MNFMPFDTWPAAALFVAILSTTGCAPSDQSAGMNAQVAQAPRSLRSDTPALITFANHSGQSVNVYWLDFGGKRQLYKTLDAGDSYTQQTFLTHPWLITSAQGQPWNVYMPEVNPQPVVLHEPGAAAIAQ